MKLYKIKKSKIDNKRGLYATKDIKEGTKSPSLTDILTLILWLSLTLSK